MQATQNALLTFRATVRRTGVIHSELDFTYRVVWIPIPHRLPQTLCIHIDQHLKINVRNLQSLVYRVLRNLFGCWVSNSVCPDTNMSWNASKNNSFIITDELIA